MTKTKLKRFDKAIEKAREAFHAEIELLAAQAREEILPYFRKHNLSFMAGNGGWVITRPRHNSAADEFVDDDELPVNIRNLLMLEVAHADHLGFYLADIRRTS